MNKTIDKIDLRFDWPGMHQSVARWINACPTCQHARTTSKKQGFPMKNIISSHFNELVQIDHQKICASDSGYTGVLVMIDHYNKLAEAAPCTENTAQETCRILINNWICRYRTPDFIQWDNGFQFTADLTKSLLKRSQISQIFSTLYHPQTNGLLEKQTRTLINMMKMYCHRNMKD